MFSKYSPEIAFHKTETVSFGFLFSFHFLILILIFLFFIFSQEVHNRLLDKREGGGEETRRQRICNRKY